MSQEEVKDQELELLSLFEQAEETFEQATARAAEEGKSFVKIPRFKMDKLGTYAIRVLPLCPDSNRKGYEFPIRQLLLKIDNPKDNKKPIYVNVCQAKQAGISVDLIDTYKTAAIDALKAKGDEEGATKITENNFGGGLKWDYKHTMFIVDMSDKKREIQMLDLSHSQFKDLDDRKLKLWEKLLKKEPKHPCPISSIAKAFPVEIEKKKDGAKTAYSFNIDNVSGYEELTNDDLKALLGAPRIDSILFRYTKYHLEATIEFLKQYDARMEINVMSTSEEVKEAIEKIKAELPADDNSSFSFDRKEKGNGEAVEGEEASLTLDDLFNRYEDLKEEGKGDKTEEGQDLRSMIRQYIEEQGLSAKVRVSRTKTNVEILDEIEKVLEEQGGESGIKTGGEGSTVEGKNDDQPDEPEVDGKAEEQNEPGTTTRSSERRQGREARRR